MKKRSDKIASAAHIKNRTKGTSNEISFSVLDAASKSLGDDKQSPKPKSSGFGGIPLFTLGRRKKPAATPTKEKGIHLPSGEFVSVEEGSSSGFGLPDTAGAAGKIVGSSGRAVSGKGDFSGNVASGSLKGGQTAGSWQSPADEVARRKTRRKRQKAFAIAVSVVVCVAVAAVGVHALVSYLQTQQDARDRLVSAISEVERADSAVIAFDELVVSVINDAQSELDQTELRESYEGMKKDLSDAYNDLVAARNLIEGLQPELTDLEDQEAADQSLVAIAARLNMVDAGRVILEETISAREAISYATSGWEQLLAADMAAREAAALVTDTSVETVEMSQAKIDEALPLFAQARENLNAAQWAYELFDATGYVDYIDLRVDAQHHARASNDAYLARDKETAGEQNAIYNEIEAQAASLAQEFVETPTETIARLYDEAVSGEIDAYAAERGIAGSADAILRDYLGTKVK